MIVLPEARKVLNEALALLDDLDGLELEDTDAVNARSHSELTGSERNALRAELAQASKDMLMLVDLCTSAGQLVKLRYWEFKGELDVDDLLGPK